MNATAPKPSAEIKLALKNSRRKRKSAGHGEVLTTKEVAKHLQLEAEEIEVKEGTEQPRKPVTKKKSSATTKMLTFGQDTDSGSNEEESEDKDYTR